MVPVAAVVAVMTVVVMTVPMVVVAVVSCQRLADHRSDGAGGDGRGNTDSTSGLKVRSSVSPRDSSVCHSTALQGFEYRVMRRLCTWLSFPLIWVLLQLELGQHVDTEVDTTPRLTHELISSTRPAGYTDGPVGAVGLVEFPLTKLPQGVFDDEPSVGNETLMPYCLLYRGQVISWVKGSVRV